MTETSSGRVRLLVWVAAGVLAMSLCAAAFVPVYSDEIGWRLQMRAAIDGVDIMFNDICGPNTLAPPAWFMWPARWFSAAANGVLADPLLVRATGVVCAVSWVGLFIVLTRRLFGDAARRAGVQVILFALLGMGILPFLLVLSRPEQPVILAATAIILVALLPLGTGRQPIGTWLKVAAILLLAAVSLSYHIKGVLYAVVALACILGCARGRGTLVPRAAGIIMLLGITLVAAQYWTARFQCPDDDRLATMLAGENVAAVLAQGSSPGDLVLQAIKGANPLNYVALAMPSARPMSNWLPPQMFVGGGGNVVILFLLLGWITGFILAGWAMVRFLRDAGWRGLFEPRLMIALAILGCVLVWGASQLNKNVYEAAHVLPMLLVAFALAWSLPGRGEADGLPIPRLLPATFAIAVLLTQTIVLGSSAGPLLQAAQSPGYPDRQPFSVSLVGYDEIRQDIAQAMAQSGIPANEPLQRLLIDDLTYLALQEHRLPLHRLGVLSTWNGSIDDPVAYLRSRDSDGVVVGCRYLPPDMASAAAQSGDICAISRAGLDRLASVAARADR